MTGDGQGDLFSITNVDPAHIARRADPDTSHAAAALVAKSFGKLQQAVLRTLLANPDGLTDAQLDRLCTEQYGSRPESSYRKRRSDLSQVESPAFSDKLIGALRGAGLTDLPIIIDTGDRRQEAGSACVVWAINPMVRAQLMEIVW